MTLRPRFAHFLLAEACVCAALAASPFANSQSTAIAAPQGQAAQPASQAPADAGLGAWFSAEQRRTEYSGFLQLVGSGDPSSLLHWTKILGIREDEEQAMRTITTDAWRRIKEINDRDYASVMERRQDTSTENIEKFLALNKELARQRKQILDETIAKLRQELGEEDFKKLDAWVYRIYGYHPKLSQAAPAKSQGSEQPAPSLATPAMTVHA